MADQSVGALAFTSRHSSLRALVRRVLSTSTLLLGARLAGAAAGFVVQILLARALPAEALGVYFSATSVTVIGGIIAAHGYPSIATRFVSRYRRRSGALLGAFVRHAQSETIVLSLGIAIAVCAFAAAWPDLSREVRIALFVAAATVPFVAAFRLYGSLATATRAFALAYLPDVCLKPMLMLALLGLLVLSVGDVTLVQAMTIMAGATIVLSAGQYILLRRGFLGALAEGTIHPRTGLVRLWRREAHAVLLVAVFAQFLPDLSILIATPVLAPSEVAVFGLCLKLAFLIGFFVMLTQNIATPDIADALNRRQAAQLGPRFSRRFAAGAALTGAGTALAALFGDEFLRLFGPGFVAGHTALTILAAAQFIRAVAGPASAVLTIAGEQRANLAIAIASIALLAAATLGLGLAFGIDGVAAAVLATMVFWCTVSGWMLHRRTGLRVDLLTAWR